MTIHEARTNPDPPEAMKLWRFKQSSLRKNPTWETFLETLHPTAEHCFFAKAEIGNFAHEVRNLTAFEAEYIWHHWGDHLRKLFGGQIILQRSAA